MAQTVSNRIYVAGLDGKISAADLRAYFGKFGALTDVYIPNNHQTGQPKHFGFVTFGSEESARECMNSPAHEINGQPVDLKPCVAKDQIAGKGCGKADATMGGLGAVGNAPLGLGMNLPLQPGFQPTMVQPALGGLGLQALQQQMLLQQQMQQQQLLQQFLAKMQQSQQLAQAQPDPMLLASLGGCGCLPASSADAATGSTMCMPQLGHPQLGQPQLGQPMMLPFGASTEMQLGMPTPLPSLGALNTSPVDQTPPSLFQGLPTQQMAGNPLMPSLEAAMTHPAFGAVPAAETGQGAARSAPY